MDEEYIACLVECAFTASTKDNNIRREKIRQILQRKPALASKLSQAREVTGNGIFFKAETDRVREVVIKLARGHAAFELNEPQLDEPYSVAYYPLVTMTPEVREDFETPPLSSILPEVGSRAMQRLVVTDPGAAVWVVAQPERYRYLATVSYEVVIRIVMGEYLGCEVVWAIA